MRIGVNLGPTGDWPAVIAVAQLADKSGFDAVSFRFIRSFGAKNLQPCFVHITEEELVEVEDVYDFFSCSYSWVCHHLCERRGDADYS